MKDQLRKRGYRWKDGTDDRPKSWCVEVDEEAFAEERAFLRREVCRREVEPYTQRITAFERFRAAISQACQPAELSEGEDLNLRHHDERILRRTRSTSPWPRMSNRPMSAPIRS